MQTGPQHPPWRSTETVYYPASTQPAQDQQHSAVRSPQGQDSNIGVFSSATLPQSSMDLFHACSDTREKLEREIGQAPGQMQAQPLADGSVRQSDSKKDHIGSRKRRKVDPADEQKPTVLIWDVDETLVLFLSLLDGSFARAFGMQV